ncbi:MAG: ATP-binding cassette domain-containing protein [Oscillibacter sp.]|nr:ATP-binding cassette domain-containing protein [Oscillibacter sp.]
MKIIVECVGKSYGGRPVLRELSFQADESRATCFVAPSGGGKTTLFRILMGLESPDAGRVSAPPDCRWAAVFQEDRLLLGRDARYNLRFALGKAYDEAQASELLETLGLGGVGKKPVRDYSGGMRRRLALARALLAPSDALILDEPFAGIDAEMKGRCLEAAARYSAGKIALLATHTLSDADALNAHCVYLA